MDKQIENLKPKFNPVFIHQEEEPIVDEINNNSNAILDDINVIDTTLIEASNKLRNLLDNTKIRLTEIKELLKSERERQEDMNILCNRYTDFASVIALQKSDFSGDLTIEENIVSAKIKSFDRVDFTVEDINGNGYEGNSYVYNNNNFTSEIINSSNRDTICDNNIATYYEYSRITIGESVDGAPIIFNKDSAEAECSIELKAEKAINKIVLYSDREDITLGKVFTSKDGLIYSLDKEYNVAINERYDRYNNQGYIYGSNIIAVEPTKHIKLFLSSNGYTNDKIAFVKNFYNSSGDSSSMIKKIEKVDSAKRHTVKINDISLFQNKYDKGMIISKELITDPITTIALYCNEYINKSYTLTNNANFFLIINGVEHEIQPINSNRNGKKIARMSAQSYKSDHVIYLNEDIKSAKLKIVINSANQDITPYLSDIKILIGGNKIE